MVVARGRPVYLFGEREATSRTRSGDLRVGSSIWSPRQGLLDAKSRRREVQNVTRAFLSEL